MVTNWDDFERVLNHTFYNVLRVCPNDHPVILSETAPQPKANREKMTQLIFESLEVPAYYPATQPALSLLSSGLMSGLVLESGDAVTISVCVYEGHTIPHTIQHLPLGGNDVTYSLKAMLDQREKLPTDCVRAIKEKLCYVSLDFDSEVKTPDRDLVQKYELPDGSYVSVGDERFTCPEMMFQPSMQNFERAGIHDIVYYSAMKCENDLRQLMFENITVTGGNMMFPGLTQRLQKEVTSRLKNTPNHTINVKVTRPEGGIFSAWHGASILASSSSFTNMTMTKEEYEEFGPALVHVKCFQ